MQWHFEFHDWEEAFKFFYRKRCGEELRDDDGTLLGWRSGDPDYVFVVSTDSHVSGYWIEKGAEPDDETKVYKTVKEVERLEKRLRQTRGATVNLSLGGVVTSCPTLIFEFSFSGVGLSFHLTPETKARR